VQVNQSENIIPIEQETKNSQNIKSYINKVSPILPLIILIVYLAIASREFFSVDNFLNIAKQSSVMGILAIGQTLVIIIAGIDLAVGSVMALTGCLIAVAIMSFGMPPLVAVIFGIVIGIVTGTLIGLVITKAKVQDFIATLGFLTAVGGVALLLTDGLPISGLPEGLLFIGDGTVYGIPIAFVVFLLVALLGGVILNKTIFGRNIYAIGGNREAAWVSGINVDFTKILVYAFSGFCASIASIVMLGRINSANALMGDGMELLSISAVVLGGTSLFGGTGSIAGTIIGVITMGVLSNGLDFLDISAFWQKVILGLVIIGVVAMDTLRRKK
jgi:ribose/xylose/arabinose/galactoside ABC-type transport system permease subunit